jgi:WD40 repeat protein
VVGIVASKKNLSSVAFSPDAKFLATAGLGDQIFIWDLPSGESVASLSGHEIAVGSLCFIEGGKTLISLGYEQSIKFWDTSKWEETKTVKSNEPGARGLLISTDESKAAISLESKVQIWNLTDWQKIEELPVGTKVISAMAHSPDGKWFAIGGADKKVRIWKF